MVLPLAAGWVPIESTSAGFSRFLEPAQGPRRKALELVHAQKIMIGSFRIRGLSIESRKASRAGVLDFLSNTHLACEIRPRARSQRLWREGLSTTTSGWAYLRCARKFWPTAADTKDMGTSERAADLSHPSVPFYSPLQSVFAAPPLSDKLQTFCWVCVGFRVEQG